MLLDSPHVDIEIIIAACMHAMPLVKNHNYVGHCMIILSIRNYNFLHPPVYTAIPLSNYHSRFTQINKCFSLKVY